MRDGSRKSSSFPGGLVTVRASCHESATMRISIYRPEEEKFQLMELDTDLSASESPSTPTSSEPHSRLTTPEHSDTESEADHPLASPEREPPRPPIPPPQPFESLPTFILVIGGLGYLGSHTTLELLRSGHNGNPPTPHPPSPTTTNPPKSSSPTT